MNLVEKSDIKNKFCDKSLAVKMNLVKKSAIKMNLVKKTAIKLIFVTRGLL